MYQLSPSNSDGGRPRARESCSVVKKETFKKKIGPLRCGDVLGARARLARARGPLPLGLPLAHDAPGRPRERAGRAGRRRGLALAAAAGRRNLLQRPANIKIIAT